MKKIVILICITIISAGCIGNKKEQMQISKTKEQIFHLPEIPSMLVIPQKRAEYLAKHYWDHFPFTDTYYKSEIIEPIFADFIGVLPHTNYSAACSGIKILMKKAEINVQLYSYLGELAKKYLYNYESPMHNEELYIPFLESMVKSPVIDNIHKSSYEQQLAMALKNRPGSMAENFIYTLASGKSYTLSALKSEYTLLFFNDPDCEDCLEIKNKINSSSALTVLQNKYKKITILSIYPDEDLRIWKEHLPDYPLNWINGYDKKLNIRNKELYDLTKMPVLYLLDREKHVLLKNASFETLENYLEKI